MDGTETAKQAEKHTHTDHPRLNHLQLLTSMLQHHLKVGQRVVSESTAWPDIVRSRVRGASKDKLKTLLQMRIAANFQHD
ncbi:hypothetical protein RB195_009355 [Necator americanus]|uniref:Uncharacterized protein n=1 Tax=Necator americanus TaxID=51031 RepID=A0ABR1CUA9_NECAM